MSKVNVKEKKEKKYTHGGSPALVAGAEASLRRTVSACMLWENTFYEEGKSIVDRIREALPKVKAEKVSDLAIEARTQLKLRHVPLLMVREMARLASHRDRVAFTLANVIQRPDELAEFVALYWQDGKCPLSAQVKKGLAQAFTKFDPYQLAKYNRDSKITLRDVMFLCHPDPKHPAQAKAWKKLAANTLEAPDTWEVSLSAGKDKKETWERLISENKLGALALLRNLRNMEQSKVSNDLIRAALKEMNTDRVLPFRFISAAKHAPHFETELEEAMMRCMANKPVLGGKTIIIVDVSGSMYGGPMSAKSELSRADAACAIAMLAREVCENPRIYATAGNDGTRIHKTAECPARRGFALKDAIQKDMYGKLGGGGIFLTPVTNWIKEREETCDRMIVVTDEQDCALAGPNAPSNAQPFGKYNYIINVGAYQNGISYGKWVNIHGFSEAVLDYIYAAENSLGGN